MANKKEQWEGRERSAKEIVLIFLTLVLFILLVVTVAWGRRGWKEFRDVQQVNEQLMGLDYFPVPVDEPQVSKQ
jgi:hypothetical protein